jgi:hypothetical protein
VLVLPLALSTTGCIKSMLTNGQISATREAAGSFNTIADYELARSAASAGLVQFQGMLELAPGNQDALFLLTSGWVGYGYAFPEDDFETATDAGDDELAAYHQKRARMAYERGVFYGKQLMDKHADGFDQARLHNDTMKKWLADNFTSKDDVPDLFWFGYAWLARVNIAQDDADLVANLYVGVDVLERANELDPAFEHYGAEVALASYHARSAMGEMEQGHKMFEDALEKTQRKSLIAQVSYAQHYACAKADKALYEKLLNEVLAAEDPDPSQRLTNMLAKRRAKRWMSRKHEMDCGMDVSGK